MNLAVVALGVPMLVLLVVMVVGYFVLRDLVGPRNAAIVAAVLIVVWLLLNAGVLAGPR